MLGDVAKWLRFFGIKAHYRQWKDEELEHVPLLLTSDRALCRRARACILIEGRSRAERVVEALCRLGLPPYPKALHCMECSSPLEEVPSSTAPVPAKVKAHHPTVYRCPSCGKHYWKGSHWRNMEAFLSLLQRLWEERC